MHHYTKHIWGPYIFISGLTRSRACSDQPLLSSFSPYRVTGMVWFREMLEEICMIITQKELWALRLSVHNTNVYGTQHAAAQRTCHSPLRCASEMWNCAEFLQQHTVSESRALCFLKKTSYIQFNNTPNHVRLYLPKATKLAKKGIPPIHFFLSGFHVQEHCRYKTRCAFSWNRHSITFSLPGRPLKPCA